MKKVVTITGFVLMFIAIGATVVACGKSDPYSISGEIEAENIGKEAIKKKDPSICEKITRRPFALGTINQEGLRYSCYRVAAVGLADPLICDRTSYRGMCYGVYATTFSDESLCKEDVESSDLCYSEIALRKNEIVICDKISDIDRKEHCYAGFAEYAKDISICTKKIHSTANKDSCFRVVASAKKDPSICERITNKKMRDECRDTISKYIEWRKYQQKKN